eukprot:10485155-Ditylum_brightwellii.AAC.1
MFTPVIFQEVIDNDIKQHTQSSTLPQAPKISNIPKGSKGSKISRNVRYMRIARIMRCKCKRVKFFRRLPRAVAVDLVG